MRIRRPRNEEPVVLPSLDRLSGLVERVVELVEQVGEATPPPAAPAEPVEESSRATVQEEAAPAGWVAFVWSPNGYRIVDGPGELPSRGGTVELEERVYRVVKVGGSPLPRDPRRCVYLAGEEPEEAARTSDG